MRGADEPAPVDGAPSRRTTWVIGAVAAVVIAATAYRATLGISGFDDSYYVAIALRLAQGARPLADEWTLQVLGALPTVPFVAAWRALFGMAGIALALRMLYVAVAAGCWYACYRALRPTFGAGFSAMVPALPLLAPPFSIFMLSYNTVALLGLQLGAVLLFAALRDRSVRSAAAASVACGFAGAAYPPLAAAVAALMVLASVLAWRRGARGLVVWIWAPAAVMALGVVAWLLSSASLAEMGAALRYSRETWTEAIAPAARKAAAWRTLRTSVTSRWALPLIALAALSALPWRSARLRALAAGALPLVALLPAAHVLLGGAKRVLGWTPSGYVIYLTAATTLTALGWVWRERDRDVGLLLALGGIAAVPGVALVTWSTSAAGSWGIPVVALGPLAVGAGLGWLRTVREGGVRWLPFASWCIALLGVAVLLCAYAFKDAPPVQLSARMTSGPLAGLATTEKNRAWFSAMQSEGEATVRPDDRVLVVGRPIGYLLLGGRIHTNAVWLNPGASDAGTVRYFEAAGLEPEHIFVADSLVSGYGGFARAAAADPLLAWILARYELAGTANGYLHFVGRPGGTRP